VIATRPPNNIIAFQERDREDLPEYLDQSLADGVTRSGVLKGMRELLQFTDSATYQWTDTEMALFFATIARSARTYEGICLLLENGLAVQGGMLARSLFEDVVVAHWLVRNKVLGTSEWMSERFIRHRAAIADLQERLRNETNFSMGPQLSRAARLEDSQDDLFKEFGRKATADWWLPKPDPKSRSKKLGMKEIVKELEDAAARREMFHPRFAGGEQAVLARMDQVIHKWLSQCVHHTAFGLPFAPVDNDLVEISPDPMIMVGFSSSWLFAQQVFLLHEVHQLDQLRLDALWHDNLANFVAIFMGPDAAAGMLEEWAKFHGLD
jgi:hypothetical protein